MSLSQKQLYLNNQVVATIVLVFCWMNVSFASEPTVKEYYEAAMQDLRKGDYEPAIEKLQNALALNRSIPDVYNLMGVAYMQKPDSQTNAVHYLEQAIELNPSLTDAYVNLGSVYASMKVEDEEKTKEMSRDCFQKALDLKPDSFKALIGLGWIYLSNWHDAKKAEEYFLEAVNLNPKQPEAQYGLGLVYAVLDRPALTLKPISFLRSINRSDLAATIESVERSRDKTVAISRVASSASGPHPQEGVPQQKGKSSPRSRNPFAPPNS